MTKKYKVIFSSAIIFLLFMLAKTGLPAQSKQLTLDDAVQLALEKNHDAKVALLNVKKANAAVREAFGYALPTVDLSANFARYIEKSKMPFPNFEGMLTNIIHDILKDGAPRVDESTSLQSFALSNNYETKAQVSQIIFNSAVFKGIGATEKYLNLSKEQVKSTVLNNITNIKKTFYGVLFTKEMLKVLNESYQNATDNLKNVTAMKEQGYASEYDEMQISVQVENIKPRIAQLENTLKNTKDALKVIIGIEQSEDIDFIGDLIMLEEHIPDSISVMTQALSNNMDIRTLQIKKDVDDAYVDINKSEYWPTVSAFANYKYSGASDNFKFMNWSESMCGLSLSINLFNGGRTEQKVQQSLLEKSKTEEQINQLEQYVKSQIKVQYAEIQRVYTTLKAQEKNVQRAQRAYEIANLRFKEGKGTQLEIKNADMELQTAKSNKFQSVFDYLSAKAELDKLIGSMDEKYHKYINETIEKYQNK